jgi:hypothetical protein
MKDKIVEICKKIHLCTKMHSLTHNETATVKLNKFPKQTSLEKTVLHVKKLTFFAC